MKCELSTMNNKVDSFSQCHIKNTSCQSNNKNKNFETLQDNVKFLQKGLAAKNDLIKSLMETKLLYSNFCQVFGQMKINLENCTKNKHVSINKSILLYWEAHNSSSKQYTPVPNNVPNKLKISWATAKPFSNWIPDSKRTQFYIVKKLFQTRTKKLERTSKFWIGE